MDRDEDAALLILLVLLALKALVLLAFGVLVAMLLPWKVRPSIVFFVPLSASAAPLLVLSMTLDCSRGW